jgi:autotransporter-associated beta strand protein
MKTSTKVRFAKRASRLILASLLAGLLQANTTHAQNGIWINPNGGSWTNTTNWQGGIVAQGADNTADFSTLQLSADATVTLDGDQTIGTLVFADRAGAHNWILNTGASGSLTLSVSANPVPIINVSNQTATIGAPLAGTQGLSQSGNGKLVLVQPIGYTGGTINNGGTIEFVSSLDASNNATFSDPLEINGGIVESAATLNLDVDQNSDAGSTNVLGAGTLRLIGTTNSITSPDLFFAPDAVSNDYYGSALDVGTLDLGSSQRYIFARTEHNAVAEYDPYEDARIDANIIGTGGLTYLAQNSWTGSHPMECPLVLAGSNTFTGTLEIQRGSVYLLNASALVQTNKLLMDPAATNNARLFLYGNDTAVANLESSGTGGILIANGNTFNHLFTIPAATLTVNQTSNTVFAGALVDTQNEYDGGSYTSGPLSLAKNGPGTLTISGASSYTGSTTVNEGELVISSLATGGGSFSVADGAALGITGIDANTVTLSDLALGKSANTTVEFTFVSPPVSFEAPVTTASLEVNGGAQSVAINIHANGTGIPVGQYPLIQYTSGSIGGSGSGFNAFKLGTLPTSVVASLVNDTTNNSIDLQVTTGTATPPANGTWINANGGSWNNAANWQGGKIAQGIGFTADFSTLRLSADATVTLDGAQTIGNLIFGDQASAHNWNLNTGSGGSLTLRSSSGSPSITVNNQTATIGAALAGTQGLSQNGNGTLILVQPIGYTGSTTNNAGTLEFLGSLGTSNNATLNSPLVINSGVVESAGTFNLDVDQNNDAGSTNVLGAGTLRLIGTNNSSASPDLFFAPDGVANDYYGAALDAAMLDLGSRQRYIFARTEHNAVAEYDPYEDARIDANIIGTAGITYIAQNTYGGGSPMECPLVLAGSNTFTGTLEIQRGSVYLFNASALVQTNTLLLDPAVSNSARLFLYGNGATVANLQSGGTGSAVIANGNVLNPVTIAPATLTVNQTANTVFGGALVDGLYEYDGGNNSPGSLSLVKNGPGSLTLTGTNAYSGSTTVDDGELVLSSLASNGGSFSVADGAALGIIDIDSNTVAMSDLALGHSGGTTVEFTFTAPPVTSVAAVTTSTLEANGGANSVTLNIHASGTGIPVGQYPLIQYTGGTIGGSGSGFNAFKLGTLPASLAASLVNDTTNNSIDLIVTGVAPSISGATLLANGVFSLTLTGIAGTGFTVHASTNLALPLSRWTAVGSGTIGTEFTPFNDVTATNYSHRFYRITTP